jgi:hypothetical protein
MLFLSEKDCYTDQMGMISCEDWVQGLNADPHILNLNSENYSSLNDFLFF